MKYPPSSRVHTNAVYSSNAHGEAIKFHKPKNTRLKWAARVSAPLPNRQTGSLRRIKLTPAEVKEMMR